jgi:RHH-type proline utilization regulon transcriptional repressor/proline dehydrogenase/delta 1-pyrroline-5-carboxylate dehydrogenase
MTLSPFVNEPLLELRRGTVRSQLDDGSKTIEGLLPLRVPVWIGEDRREGAELLSTDPGNPELVVAEAAMATAEEVSAAVALAEHGAREWSQTPVERRAEALIRAAQWLRERRLEIAALETRECAKPWTEADADVCEAIDFLEYYAREAIDVATGPGLLQMPGERNSMRYVARGVVAVISPWNFPLAIPCGMVAAGLATGNAVILKPAEQSPGCAFILARALRESGVPPEAFALLPGDGEVGAALVRDPRVHTIAFTGSVAVGLEIVRAAAETPPGQNHLKRVIAEMGGKNCVIVDSDADLDDAVPAVVKSAFVYAGQKCSAASRVLVHESIYETFVQRIAGAVRVLNVGQATDLNIDVPPVIEEEAQSRVARYIDEIKRNGTVVASPEEDTPSGGWFATPTLGAELPTESPVLNEEIFGPVLAIERIKTVEEACDRVDASSFALTGGLFARNPDTIDYVSRRSPVGNLYINRHITGAMVGRQPFGGNRLSGTGTKAGGPDYLLHFVEPRVVCENTVRHGLVI